MCDPCPRGDLKLQSQLTKTLVTLNCIATGTDIVKISSIYAKGYSHSLAYNQLCLYYMEKIQYYNLPVVKCIQKKN
jgi:hypothetical protein